MNNTSNTHVSWAEQAVQERTVDAKTRLRKTERGQFTSE